MSPEIKVALGSTLPREASRRPLHRVRLVRSLFLTIFLEVLHGMLSNYLAYHEVFGR